MAGCFDILLQCLAGAVAGIGTISLCWRMQVPLRLAEHYDVKRAREQGLYVAMSIYGYLRRYFSILLLAGCVILLLGVATSLILASGPESCPEGFESVVVVILAVFLSAHISTIAAFETAKRRHQPGQPPFVAVLVKDVQKRLYGVAVFLLLAIALVAFARFPLFT